VTLAQSGKGHALSVINGGSDLPEGFNPTPASMEMTQVTSLAARSAVNCGSIAARTRLHEITELFA
jgi:hypothetical protein